MSCSLAMGAAVADVCAATEIAVMLNSADDARQRSLCCMWIIELSEGKRKVRHARPGDGAPVNCRKCVAAGANPIFHGNGMVSNRLPDAGK